MVKSETPTSTGFVKIHTIQRWLSGVQVVEAEKARRLLMPAPRQEMGERQPLFVVGTRLAGNDDVGRRERRGQSVLTCARANFPKL